MKTRYIPPTSPIMVMELAGEVLARRNLLYTPNATATDKMHYQEKKAAELLALYRAEVIRAGVWPVFYVVVGSSMNMETIKKAA